MLLPYCRSRDFTWAVAAFKVAAFGVVVCTLPSSCEVQEGTRQVPRRFQEASKVPTRFQTPWHLKTDRRREREETHSTAVLATSRAQEGGGFHVLQVGVVLKGRTRDHVPYLLDKRNAGIPNLKN